MPLSRVQQIPPQPTPQRLPPGEGPALPTAFNPGALIDLLTVGRLIIRGGHLVAIGGALPTISGLNASISVATVQARSSDIAGMVVLTTTANIPANSNLFTIGFARPYDNPPIVLCGGGVGGNNDFFAVSPGVSGFQVWNTMIVGTAAGQTMTWIAIGQ